MHNTLKREDEVILHAVATIQSTIKPSVFLVSCLAKRLGFANSGGNPSEKSI